MTDSKCCKSLMYLTYNVGELIQKAENSDSNLWEVLDDMREDLFRIADYLEEGKKKDALETIVPMAEKLTLRQYKEDVSQLCCELVYLAVNIASATLE